MNKSPMLDRIEREKNASNALEYALAFVALACCAALILVTAASVSF